MDSHFTHIIKRDGSTARFSQKKIEDAIYRSLKAVKLGTRADASYFAERVRIQLNNDAFLARTADPDTPFQPSVEKIQDLVEDVLMLSTDFRAAAKSYILYREQKNIERRRDLYKRRVNLMPHEYPELLEYVDAIRHSYWVHTEFNYISDVQDFKVNVTPVERSAIENAMLAIAQIEAFSVKTFWGDIYRHIPKPEVGSVGYTFAESEVRHQDAYAHLLDILGLNKGFEQVIEVPAIKERIRYLSASLEHAFTDDKRDYMKTVLLFSLFIEHVSLFSQFLIIMAFNKHKNIFKGISNAIEATSKEEQIHGLFGIELINILREERPEWFDADLEADILRMCEQAFASEVKVIDWIYEKGDLDFMPKAVVKEFVKNRLNNSLKSIGYSPIFDTDAELLETTDWFDIEVLGTKHGDFFVKRSTNYNKRSKSITAEDLF